MSRHDMVNNILSMRKIFDDNQHQHPRVGDFSDIQIEDLRDSGQRILIKSENIGRLQVQIWDENEPIPKTITKGFNQTIWKTKALRIVYFVSKFLQQLKQSTDRIKFKMVDKKIFRVINDQASDFSFYVRNKLINQNLTCEKLLINKFHRCAFGLPSKIIQNVPIIYPDGYIRMIFDTILVMTIIINIFYIPYDLAFNLQNSESTLVAFFMEDFPSWMFICEVLLNFNTAYYYEGIIHTNRKAIFNQYFRNQFLWDILIIIPFIISRFNVPYVKFALLFRVTRIKEKFDNFEEVLNLREKFSALIDLIRLIYFVIFVSHFCACVWYYVAVNEEKAGNESWLTANNIYQLDTYTKYIYSLYYCTITITTVGYGDITPTTSTERIVAICMTLVTCGVFGYAINNIGSIFKEMEEKKVEFKTQMARVNLHLKRHDISHILQLQVRKYFEYFFQREKENDTQVRDWFQHLPIDLRRSLQVDKYRSVLLRSKFFRENLSGACINDLCQQTVETEYSPDDIIFHKNDYSENIYFVETGEVQIVFQNHKVIFDDDDTGGKPTFQTKETILRKFQPGYVLGEKNYLLQRPMDYQANASKFSVIIQIGFEDFINTLKKHPDDYEKYCLMRDQLNLNQQFKKIVSVCEICGYNHAFTKCPFTFFLPNKHKLIMNQRSGTQPYRRYYNRSSERRTVRQPQLNKRQALACAIDLGELSEKEVSLDSLVRWGIVLGESRLEQPLLSEDDSVGSGSQKQSQRIAPSMNFFPTNKENIRRPGLQLERTNSLMKKIYGIVRKQEKDPSLVQQAVMSQQLFHTSDLSAVDEDEDEDQLKLEPNPLTLIRMFEPPEFELYRNYDSYNPQSNLDIIIKILENHRVNSSTYRHIERLGPKDNDQVNRFLEEIKYNLIRPSLMNPAN